MTEFRADKLIEIADLLEGKHTKYKIPKDGKFDLLGTGDQGFWISEENGKTVACAMGWAIKLIPWFQRTYKVVEGGVVLELRKPINGFVHDCNHIPLGISMNDFVCLFTNSAPVDVKTNRRLMARHIRKFVREKTAPLSASAKRNPKSGI